MGGSWHERVFLSAQSALRHTNPQSGIEGKVRFEGWYWRPFGIEGAELWRRVGFDLQGGRDRVEVWKRATARPQSEARALPRGLGVQPSRTSLTGSKGERRSSSPNHNPSSLRDSRSDREQA